MQFNLQTITSIVPLIALVPACISLVLAFIQLRRNERNRKVDNAIKYCDRFALNVLPNYQAYKLFLHQNQFNFIQKPSGKGIKSFKGQDLSLEQLKLLDDQSVYKVLNELDIIAIAINKNSVDYDTTKEIIGLVFCEAIEVYSPMILAMRVNNTFAFKNAVQLYSEWRPCYEKGVETPLNSMD